MDDRSAWDSLQREIVSCEKCPRLRAHCVEIGRVRRSAYRDFDYWSKPVPDFGDPRARLLLVGLAPGAHGANRTGRMFTGDRSGDFLFRALHEARLADGPVSIRRGDGLALLDCAITAAVHCAPPDNHPTGEERKRCFPYLVRTIESMPRLRALVALGAIAFESCIRLYRTKDRLEGIPSPRFAHGAFFRFPGAPALFASYHPSQQNTFTGRLTMQMLVEVLAAAAAHARGAAEEIR
ncbi:MAG: uracil-DNA glycosylase [Candidatus Eisenbacteria bacterium]|nr:uracil-DNA glycosylase [Candidatus Eisenbacteria bacterium]